MKMTDMSFVYNAVLTGVGATLVMDIWALLLRYLFKISSLDMRIVGRWIAGMARGQFFHAHIGQARPVKGEGFIGWGAHYLIGILFAGAFLWGVRSDWIKDPAVLPAILFGIITVLFPFCLMQPAFGFGIAAARTPAPNIARLKSLVSHTVFGGGLYLSGWALAQGGGAF